MKLLILNLSDNCWKYTLKTLSALTIWFWLYLQNQMAYLANLVEQWIENWHFGNLLKVRIFFMTGCCFSEKLQNCMPVMRLGVNGRLNSCSFWVPIQSIQNICLLFAYNSATVVRAYLKLEIEDLVLKPLTLASLDFHCLVM